MNTSVGILPNKSAIIDIEIINIIAANIKGGKVL